MGRERHLSPVKTPVMLLRKLCMVVHLRNPRNKKGELSSKFKVSLLETLTQKSQK